MGNQLSQEGTLGVVEAADHGLEHQAGGGREQSQGAGQHVGLPGRIVLDAEFGLIL